MKEMKEKDISFPARLSVRVDENGFVSVSVHDVSHDDLHSLAEEMNIDVVFSGDEKYRWTEVSGVTFFGE